MDSLGTIFRDAREKNGWTIDQVYEYTHISREFIAAIEKECFDQLPGDAYCVGFLNNLAKYYGLDAKEIVQLYKKIRFQNLEQYQQADSVVTVTPVSVRKAIQWKKIIRTGMIMLVFAVAVILFIGLNIEKTDEPVVENVVAAEEPVPEEKADVEKSGQVQVENTTVDKVDDTQIVSELDDNSSVIIRRAERIPFSLNIEFNGYCFFRYKINNGNPVEKYYQKGDSLKINIPSEVKVWMSNAGAVKSSILGNEIYFGGKGVVSSNKILWEKTSDGNYCLVVAPMH